ncbi:MAG: phosphate regulon sensor histidine kinase PhoR [Pseudohongiellaceae bacterium]
MLQDWQKEIYRIILLVALSGIAGLLFGRSTLFVILALTAYLGFTLVQLRRLDKWLSILTTDPDRAPPEGPGFWGSIFDGIFRLQQRQKHATLTLQSILDKAQASSAALEIAVILIDRRGNLEWWNKAGETLLGLRYPADRNQAVTNLVRNPQFSEYFHKEQYSEPLTLSSPVNNNMLEFQLATFGERERLMVVRDITQIHKLELMREDFVGNVSHELRTPITVISGYLEAMLGNPGSIDPRWHKPLQQMQQQSNRMENIVRDLLMLSRLETKAVTRQLTDIDVNGLLSEVRNDTMHIFEEKQHNIAVECNPDFRLRGDRGELYSAISNLAFNAAKYTSSKGKITLTAEATENSFDIIVSDDGIGIESQHIPRLTERFYRVDASRATDTGGTGLGLAIVKHILVRHNASIEVNSVPGKGSSFRCRFPLSRLVKETIPGKN